jgi:hypothetical protein
LRHLLVTSSQYELGQQGLINLPQVRFKGIHHLLADIAAGKIRRARRAVIFIMGLTSKKKKKKKKVLSECLFIQSKSSRSQYVKRQLFEAHLLLKIEYQLIEFM